MNDELDAPIATTEITFTISHFLTHKTSGLKGFPDNWQSKFKQWFSPYLQDTFRAVLEAEILTPSMQEAPIVLILLKAHKDPTKCESYHPISLINADVKYWLKFLLLRLIN